MFSLNLERIAVENIKIVNEKKETAIYKCLQKSDSKPIIVKILRDEYPNAQTLAALQHEFHHVKGSNKSRV